MTSTLLSLVACTVLAPCPSYESGVERPCLPTISSETCLTTLLSSLRQQPHPSAVQLIWALERLAIVRMNQGRWDEALPMVQEAYEQAFKLEGPHPAQAETAGLLAAFYRRQNNPARALPLLRRSLAVDEQIFGRHDPHTVPVLVELGTLLIGEGRETEAGKLFDRANAIIDASGMSNTREKLLLDLGIAELAMRQRKLEQAQSTYRAALASPLLDSMSKVHVHAALAAIAKVRRDKTESASHRAQGIALARQFPDGANLVRSIFGQ